MSASELELKLYDVRKGSSVTCFNMSQQIRQEARFETGELSPGNIKEFASKLTTTIESLFLRRRGQGAREASAATQSWRDVFLMFNMHGLTLAQYILRLVKCTYCSRSMFIVGIMYLCRLLERGYEVHSQNIRVLFVVAIAVGAKVRNRDVRISTLLNRNCSACV